MGENEEGHLVDKAITDAKNAITKHAAECIELVGSMMTVSQLRSRLRHVTADNCVGLVKSLNHSHDCDYPSVAVYTVIHNLRLLFLPLATNPATGESLSTFRERVIRSIEQERDMMLAEVSNGTLRERAIQYVTALRGLETAMAMEELNHGATRN